MTKGSGLRELERRLKDEPDNLGLRVTVAGAMHDAGRKADAVELYRSVAVAYRDQGRTQQAIAVCRSILEIAPDDAPCSELLASLAVGRPEGSHSGARVRPAEGSRPGPTSPGVLRAITPPGAIPVTPSPPQLPTRRSSLDETPLPGPLPYHVADPTTRSLKKLSEVDLPTAEGVETRPGSSGTPPPVDGIANAARRISAELSGRFEALQDDISAELDTRQRPRIESAELHKISRPPPTSPVARVDFDEAPTPPPRDTLKSDAIPIPDTEEELTVPRELPTPDGRARPIRQAGDVTRVREPITNTSAAMLGTTFFAPLPAPRRAAVLSRFHRRVIRAGESVIRQGDADPALVIVGRGRLEVRVERGNGTLVVIESVGSGDYIGEGALLSRTPAAAHVVAATDAELLVLLPHDFYEIAGAFPALWSQLKETADRRARDTQAKLRER